MLEGYCIRKNDTAACLTAALLSGIYHHFHDGTGITQRFVTELCEMLSDEGIQPVEVLQGLVNAALDLSLRNN